MIVSFKVETFIKKERKQKGKNTAPKKTSKKRGAKDVSYTHMTLPTNRGVQREGLE